MPRVAVVIPARDEAGSIEKTLSSLCRQRGAGPFGVLVVANNCTDDTAQRAREWAGRLPLEVHELTLPKAHANVVGARRLALNLGAAWAGPSGVVVSTDADTEAQSDWLSGLLAPLHSGADASAGRILLRHKERQALPPLLRRTHLLDTGYRMAAAALRSRILGERHPTHWQHFGANLALKVSAYHAVGGLPDVSCLEDVALVEALRRHDLSLVHTHAAKVLTSARRSGRVPVGLSTQLGEWERGPEGWHVPGGAEVLAAARAEGLLRQGGGISALALAWRVEERAVQEALNAATLGGQLEWLTAARDRMGRWHAEFRPVLVQQALWQVRSKLVAWGGEGFRTLPSPCKGEGCGLLPV